MNDMTDTEKTTPSLIAVLAGAVAGGVALSLASAPILLLTFGFFVDGMQAQVNSTSMIVFVVGALVGRYAVLRHKAIVLWILAASGIAGILAMSLMI